MGKGENVDDGAVQRFAGRTAAEIFAGQENTVYSPITCRFVSPSVSSVSIPSATYRLMGE